MNPPAKSTNCARAEWSSSAAGGCAFARLSNRRLLALRSVARNRWVVNGCFRVGVEGSCSATSTLGCSKNTCRQSERRWSFKPPHAGATARGTRETPERLLLRQGGGRVGRHCISSCSFGCPLGWFWSLSNVPEYAPTMRTWPEHGHLSGFERCEHVPPGYYGAALIRDLIGSEPEAYLMQRCRCATVQGQGLPRRASQRTKQIQCERLELNLLRQPRH